MLASAIAPIDLATLSTLDELSTDPQFLVSLIAGFVRDSEEQLRVAREALASAALSGVRDAMHAMQGTSGSVGAVGLMRACMDVGRRSNAELEHEGAALIEGLAVQLEESRILLERYLGDRVRRNR
ncbi:MAG: Hpt domain-containing protein [Burkholderiales bacterium]